MSFLLTKWMCFFRVETMSWAVEEWKDGLPGKALQKIQEMEVQLDKLKKERTQKQFQLESLEAALQKQKQKVSGQIRNRLNDTLLYLLINVWECPPES